MASTPRNLQHELGKKRPFESPEVEAFLNILRTASLLASETGRFLKSYGLSEPQYNALRILRGHGDEGIRSQMIGDQLVAQVPDVTRLVDRLVAADLAERCGGETDKRVVIVKITRKALDLLARIDRPLLDLHKRQLGHMAAADLRRLSALLAKARRQPDEGDIRDRCPAP